MSASRKLSTAAFVVTIVVALFEGPGFRRALAWDANSDFDAALAKWNQANAGADEKAKTDTKKVLNDAEAILLKDVKVLPQPVGTESQWQITIEFPSAPPRGLLLDAKIEYGGTAIPPKTFVFGRTPDEKKKTFTLQPGAGQVKGEYKIVGWIPPSGVLVPLLQPAPVNLGSAPALTTFTEPPTAVDKVDGAGTLQLNLKNWVVKLAKTYDPPLVSRLDTTPGDTTERLSKLFGELAETANKNAVNLKGLTADQAKPLLATQIAELKAKMRKDLDALYEEPGVKKDWRPFLLKIETKVMSTEKIDKGRMDHLTIVFAQLSDAFAEIGKAIDARQEKIFEDQQNAGGGQGRSSAVSGRGGSYNNSDDDGCRRRRRRRPFCLLVI